MYKNLVVVPPLSSRCNKYTCDEVYSAASVIMLCLKVELLRFSTRDAHQYPMAYRTREQGVLLVYSLRICKSLLSFEPDTVHLNEGEGYVTFLLFFTIKHNNTDKHYKC